jgi:predicted nucleic acid-binding protein
MIEIFLDTSYALALTTRSDRHHILALRISRDVRRSKVRLVTTRAVLLEIGNALSKTRRRREGIGILEFLETDPGVEILPLSDDLFRRGFDLFRRRSDKDWGLVDCISFTVMQDRNVRESLTTDEHFEQAGFRALMR